MSFVAVATLILAAYGAVLSTYTWTQDRRMHRRENRRRLQVLSEALLAANRRLYAQVTTPGSGSGAEWRIAWSEEELREFDSLAAREGGEILGIASETATHLRWISSKLPSDGNVGGRFPFDEWARRKDQVDCGLKRILELV